MHACTDKDVWIERWIHGWWVERCMQGWVNVWTAGWIDGRMDFEHMCKDVRCGFHDLSIMDALKLRCKALEHIRMNCCSNNTFCYSILSEQGGPQGGFLQCEWECGSDFSGWSREFAIRVRIRRQFWPPGVARLLVWLWSRMLLFVFEWESLSEGHNRKNRDAMP